MAKIIKRGSKGHDVKDVQQCLHLFPDGIFGPLTEEAVKDFQRQNSLEPDGIVGPLTMQALGITPSDTRRIDEIIVHCSATPEGEDYSVETIRQWHLGRGFSDIGYHYVIDRDGTVHLGRDISLAGAHCLGHNSRSIGICYIGGCAPRSAGDWQHLPLDTRTEEQKASLRNLIASLQEKYPGAQVHCHNEFADKPCPSFLLCDL